MAKHVFYLTFSLSILLGCMSAAMPALLFPSGLLFCAAVLAFASHLFTLLEDIARNLRESTDAQVESSRTLYRIEKAMAAKD